MTTEQAVKEGLRVKASSNNYFKGAVAKINSLPTGAEFTARDIIFDELLKLPGKTEQNGAARQFGSLLKRCIDEGVLTGVSCPETTQPVTIYKKEGHAHMQYAFIAPLTYLPNGYSLKGYINSRPDDIAIIRSWYDHHGSDIDYHVAIHYPHNYKFDDIGKSDYHTEDELFKLYNHLGIAGITNTFLAIIAAEKAFDFLCLKQADLKEKGITKAVICVTNTSVTERLAGLKRDTRGNKSSYNTLIEELFKQFTDGFSKSIHDIDYSILNASNKEIREAAKTPEE